jgi:hypothetical protein
LRRQRSSAAESHRSPQREEPPTIVETDEMVVDDEGSSGGGGSNDVLTRQFNVGGGRRVHGTSEDLVGLVGSVVVVSWEGVASRCHVDAYAPDAPGGPAYVISWVSRPNEHHLLLRTKMAELGAQCSRSVKSKLKGTLSVCARSAASQRVSQRVSVSAVIAPL